MGIASMTAPLVFTQMFSAAIGPYRSWNLPGIPFLTAAVLLMCALAMVRRVSAHAATPGPEVE